MLISTKLYVPRARFDLVPRERLIERLNAGLGGKLTLVSAPAGYGKTTLVSSWVARSEVPVAWLSLDPSDNDPARFVSYLIAAIQAATPQTVPPIGAEIQQVLEPGADLSVERLLTALINDLVASATPLVLVLDDYHVIQDFGIHQALDFLLNHLPSPASGASSVMHLVLLSRSDPPMPLGRLRVQRALTEIREADLRFTAEEAEAFLNDTMALSLSEQDVADLGARTEGWIAGLHLAALALEGRPDRADRIATIMGSQRYLVDYLGEEVMSLQPEDVRTFLLRSSILERFNVSLCDAILDDGRRTQHGGSPSGEILDQLKRANLFLVPLDEEDRWFRYHHLFRDFLQRRLHRRQPALVPELYLRASRWYEDQGMIDEAIEHALSGEDVTRATKLLDRHGEAYVFDARISNLIRWAKRLPEEELRKFPRLCIYCAWALQFEVQLEAAEAALACAEEHLGSTVPPEHIPFPSAASQSVQFSASQIAHHARAIRVYIALQNDEYDLAIELARAALEELPEEAAHELAVVRGAALLGLVIGYFYLGQVEAASQAVQRAIPPNQQCGNRFALLSCIFYQMRIDLVSGKLNQALADGRKGLQWLEQWTSAEGQRRPLARVLAHIRQTMALVHYERNELEEAARYARLSTDYYELVGSRYRATGYALLVDLHLAMGDMDAARGWLRKLVETDASLGFSTPFEPVAAMIAERRLLLSRTDSGPGDLFAGAERWAETVDLSPYDRLSNRREYEYLVLARVRIAQGRAAEVLPMLDRLVARARGEEAGTAARNGQLIAFLAVQAIAYDAYGQTAAAHNALDGALALGEPENYVRTFVDHGEPMEELLRQAEARGLAVDYVGRLLSVMHGEMTDEERTTATQVSSTVARTSPGHQSPPLVEPLSEREMQILRFIAAGLTDRQIAEQLYLSVNTVKWHNRQIYAKLGVGRRGEAVSRARGLDLL